MKETVQALMAALGEKLDIENLALDEDGYCCLGFDDVVVNIEYEEDRDEFLLFAKVADTPADISPRYVEEVLDLSYGGMLTTGGSLGLDRSAGALMFADRVALRGLDDEAFEKTIESFVDRAENWHSVFAGPEFVRATADGPKLEDMGAMMRI